MKIALKCLLIVAFIFSLSFFLSRPVLSASGTVASDYTDYNDVLDNSVGIAGYLWNLTYPDAECEIGNNFVLQYTPNWYFFSSQKYAAIDFFSTISSSTCEPFAGFGLKQYLSNPYLRLTMSDGSTWNSFAHWYSKSSRGSSSGSPVYTYGTFENWPIYNLSTLDTSIKSPVNLNAVGNFTGMFDYGSLGSITTGDLLLIANWNTTAPAPIPKTTYKYYIEYRDNFVSTSWLRLEFNDIAYISSSYAVGANLIGFTDSEWVLYETNGTQRAELDSSSSYYPPYLYIADANNPCASILRSNVGLRDDNGNIVCMATVNPVVEEIAKKFTGIVNYDTATDLGMFEPLEPVIAWAGQVVDDVALWFHGLWVNFLNLIIPMPDFLTYAFQQIKIVADEKFAQIDLSSLENFGQLETDTMPNITTSLMGVTVTIVNFDLIKPHIALLRTIMIATVGLFLILFNINQVNKLLSDNPVTE